jgi:type I restriction enzyme S subunit
VRTVPLREAIEPRNEIVHPRDNPRGEATFVGLEHIEPNTGRRIGSLPIRLDDLTGRKASFRSGDIVYGYLRPYLNKVWVADFEGYCSVDQYVFRAKPGFDPDFVAAFMRSPQFLERAPIDETPGQLPRIRTDEVLAVEMPSPPPSGQGRIAAKLRGQLASAAAVRQGIEQRLDGAASLRAATILRGAAGGPRRAKLSDTATVQLGKMLGPAARTGNNPAPYLRNANVQWGRVSTDDLLEMDFDEEERAKFALEDGDVLVCEGGEPGRAAVWRGGREGIYYQKALHRVRCDPRLLDPDFLVYALWAAALTGEFAGENSKSTIAHLPAVRLSALPLPLPPVADQRRIAQSIHDDLASIDAMTKAIEAQREAADALPAALLRRAFEEIEAA